MDLLFAEVAPKYMYNKENQFTGWTGKNYDQKSYRLASAKRSIGHEIGPNLICDELI